MAQLAAIAEYIGIASPVYAEQVVERLVGRLDQASVFPFSGRVVPEVGRDEIREIIEPPYRWRDWAAVQDKTQRLTGDELIDFVNNRLIPYLGRLSGSSERDIRTIIGTIFQGTYNRIRSGYILREVVDKLSTINFNSSDDSYRLDVL